MPGAPRAGLSLLEVAVVLVVAAALASLAIPRFRAYEHRVHRGTLVRALRDLAAAENAYWRTVGTYTGDAGALPGARSAGISVRIVSADSLGWSARAIAEDDPSVECAIFYGTAPILPPASRRNIIGCAP